METQPQEILDYSNLPSPKRKPRPKKPQVVLLGYFLILFPTLAGTVIGFFITLSNIISPGKSYRIGNSTAAPQSQSLAMEWFKLILCLLLATFLSAILWRAIVISQKTGRESSHGR